MLKGENILCVSWLYWNEIPLVMHHMMTRLSVYNRVLWVDPPFPLTLFLTQPRMVRSYVRKLAQWRRGPTRASDNLWIYYPGPLMLFYGRVAIVDRFNQRVLSRTIAGLLRRLEFHSPIVWLYHPYALMPKGEFSEKLVCYDCNDDMGSFFYRLPYQRKRLSCLEGDLVRSADVVFTTSMDLYESKRMINPHTFYFPSGADVSLFSKVLLPSTRVADDIGSIRKPIIGFIGGIANSKMDWELIEKAAERRPKWSFVFIGPLHERLPSGIAHAPNIHFLGKRPMEELPCYLKAFDVCIIPYKEGDFMRSSFPTKTFEYLAAGKPVVASDIPALREFQPTVKLYRDLEMFIVNTEQSLREADDGEAMKIRYETAEHHTWDARVESTSLVIQNLLDSARSRTRE